MPFVEEIVSAADKATMDWRRIREFRLSAHYNKTVALPDFSWIIDREREAFVITLNPTISGKDIINQAVMIYRNELIRFSYRWGWDSVLGNHGETPVSIATITAPEALFREKAHIQTMFAEALRAKGSLSRVQKPAGNTRDLMITFPECWTVQASARLAVIGGASAIGREVMRQGLERGHHMVALADEASGIEAHPGLSVVPGHAGLSESLRAAVKNVDAVLITRALQDQHDSPTQHADFARALLQVVPEAGERPVILLLSRFGAGQSRHYLPSWRRATLSWYYPALLKDVGGMELTLSESYSRWQVIRVRSLTDGPKTAAYNVMNTLKPGVSVRPVSCKDVASYLLDEARDASCERRYVTISG